uniref:Uncharacterized protein n=1 Tax=Anopheles melas TaxID=34690 RepID=A0A182TPM2_9DIPT
MLHKAGDVVVLPADRTAYEGPSIGSCATLQPLQVNGIAVRKQILPQQVKNVATLTHPYTASSGPVWRGARFVLLSMALVDDNHQQAKQTTSYVPPAIHFENCTSSTVIR